ncbi:MAG: alpha-xenorhabdolysin family binary toxin subunit A [Lachnospiraceae bacterium]|nr:alpha-xenorhabdolysin family binary toxin subunit A [Lachnospiraceae bacterium]
MAEPLRRSTNALLEAIVEASQNAEPAKFGQTAASVLSLMDGTSRIEAFRGIVNAAGAADELSEVAVHGQKGLIVSKDDLKCILKYVDMAKSLPLTKEMAEAYLGYKSDDSFFQEEKHKFLVPEKQVAFDKPIYDHAVQWDPLAVEIQNVGKTLTNYAGLFTTKVDSVIKVLGDLNKYLKVHGFIADNSGKEIVECGTEILRLWKDDTGRYKDTVQKTYGKLVIFRDTMNDRISKSVRDRAQAIAALNLCADQQKLKQEIDELKQEIASLEKEYNEAVGLAFTGAAVLILGFPGIIAWAITGGIYGDRAEKIRKKKNEKSAELKPLEEKLDAYSKIDGSIKKLETSITDISHALFSADIGLQHIMTAWNSLEQDIDNAILHLNRMDDPAYVKYVLTLTSELNEARTSWSDCGKIAEDLLKCFGEAYTEYEKTK